VALAVALQGIRGALEAFGQLAHAGAQDHAQLKLGTP
jgi:hypothetical protein